MVLKEVVLLISTLISASFTPKVIKEKEVSLSYVSIGADVARANIFGCGDSLVTLKKNLPETEDQLSLALIELLNSPDIVTNSQGQEFYNALGQSSLSIDRVESDGSTARVYLKGQLTLPESCDNTRVGEQLVQTVKNNTMANRIKIFINDEPLNESSRIYEGL